MTRCFLALRRVFARRRRTVSHRHFRRASAPASAGIVKSVATIGVVTCVAGGSAALLLLPDPEPAAMEVPSYVDVPQLWASVMPVSVPEPSALALYGIGVAILAWAWRTR